MNYGGGGQTARFAGGILGDESVLRGSFFVTVGLQRQTAVDGA